VSLVRLPRFTPHTQFGSVHICNSCSIGVVSPCQRSARQAMAVSAALCQVAGSDGEQF
jgi:hypothetical protein